MKVQADRRRRTSAGLWALGLCLALVVPHAGSSANGSGTTANATQLAQATPDVHYIVKWLDYSGHYQLQIENLSPLGMVTSFDWAPPPSLRITTISSSTGGSCNVADSGAIACNTKLRPPSCAGGSCQLAATTITVEFTAALTGKPPGSTFADLMWGASLQLTGLTLEPSSYSDLPRCRKDTVGTRKHPCAPNG